MYSTAFSEAMKNGSNTIVALFKYYGYGSTDDITMKDVFKGDYSNISRYLIGIDDINKVDSNNKNVLSYAIESKNLDIVKLVLNRQFEIVKYIDYIVESIISNDYDIFTFLLSKSDITNRDTYEIVTMLITAINYNRYDILCHIVDKYNVDNITKSIDTSKVRCVEYIVEPLSFAVHNGNCKIVEFFIEKGVNLYHSMDNLIDISLDNGNKSMTKLLIMNGYCKIDIDKKNIKKFVKIFDDLTIFEKIVNNMRPNDKQYFLDISLIKACRYNKDIAIVRFLIEQGADIYYKDYDI